MSQPPPRRPTPPRPFSGAAFVCGTIGGLVFSAVAWWSLAAEFGTNDLTFFPIFAVVVVISKLALARIADHKLSASGGIQGVLISIALAPLIGFAFVLVQIAATCGVGALGPRV